MQKQVVAGHAKAARELRLEGWNAAFQFVDLLAVATKKVMVVFLAGKLIARRFAGELDRNEPFFLDQIFEVAIDGSDTEVVHAALRIRENLIRREGAIRFNEGRANRVFLAGVPC